MVALQQGRAQAASKRPLISPTEVAKRLGISRRTLYDWIAGGYFPAPTRFGPDGRMQKWEVDEVEAFIEAEKKRTREVAHAAYR